MKMNESESVEAPPHCNFILKILRIYACALCSLSGDIVVMYDHNC